MKLNTSLILSILLVVGLVALGFTFFQITHERARLHKELNERMQLGADRFSELIFPDLERRNVIPDPNQMDSILIQCRLLAISIHFRHDSILFVGEKAISLIPYSSSTVLQVLNDQQPVFNTFSTPEGRIAQLLIPNSIGGENEKLTVYYASASYIDGIIGNIWLRNFLRWFLQVLFVSIITLLIIQWRIFSPINKIVNWIKAARTGHFEELKSTAPVEFLAPLQQEIKSITKAMQEARLTAEEEARLRAQSESIWTPERLRIEMESLLQDKMLVVVSNREPYMHIREGKEIKCIVPASGMITAMEPILKACGGLWMASGSGDADKETVDQNDKLKVPPENPAYTLRRLWLTPEEERHYYYGFSNEGLWPLCHIAHTRPVFRKDDWYYYQKVNKEFAKAILQETKDIEAPYILIQDYHFALLPELIKNRKPKARIAIFWHIPWPNPESFGICPWRKEILTGMLGADLIGFHTQYHCNNFMETVNHSLEARVLWENFSIKMGGHTTLVKPFPISIAFTPKDLDHAEPPASTAKLLEEYGISATHFGIGVDRIDYTKGIIEKFLSIERFFEKYPDYVGKFTFLQIGAPSRTFIKNYSDMVSAVDKEAQRINLRFKLKNWKAIILLKKHHSHKEIKPLYQAADLCMVTSLHDGMNLVSKEFIAERSHNDGVLILSRFAGASQHLKGALIINPYDTEETAEAIKTALEMPVSEQHIRMQKMRQEILNNNIYTWAAKLIKTMSALSN